VDVEDEEEVEEEDGDLGIDELVGGEGGGDLLKDFKGVLRTSFGTCKGITTFVSNRGMEYIKYSSPRGDLVLNGPHTSVCTSSRGLLADPSFSGKLVLVCLPN